MFFVGKTDINIEFLRMYEVMMILLMPQAKLSCHSPRRAQKPFSGDRLDVPLPMYHYGKSLYGPFLPRYLMGHDFQECLENTINAMDKLLGVHPWHLQI